MVQRNAKVLPLTRNPYARWYDNIPYRLKIWVKRLFTKHHNIIIPKTQNHTTWVLGAQPDKAILQQVQEQFGANVFLISLLHKDETVVGDNVLKQDPALRKVERKQIAWFDHSIIDVYTGKNACVAAVIAQQKAFYLQFMCSSQALSADVIYCHCMAGVARSFVLTIIFLYCYPDKSTLFDCKNWPQDMVNKIPEELQQKLRTQPTISDIARFVKIQRPLVKELTKLDNDQAGFLGLVALHIYAQRDFYVIDDACMVRLAQDIGLVLYAPLDCGVRDQEDRQQQTQNFYKVFVECEQVGRGSEFLEQIVIQQALLQGSKSEDFLTCFKCLPPNQQERYAILLQDLEIKGVKFF